MRTLLFNRFRPWFVGTTLSMAFMTTWSIAGDIDTPTHRQSGVIRPMYQGSKASLKTFCMAPDGSIVAACQSATNDGVLLFLDSTGKTHREIKLDFVPTALNFGGDGTLYVAGDGKLVHLTAEGKQLNASDSPASEFSKEDIEKAIETAKLRNKEIYASFDQQIEQIKKQIEKIESKPEKERSKIEKARLTAYQEQLKSYESITLAVEVDPANLIASAKRITSIAVGKDAVFMTCGRLGDYGYNIWRTDLEFKDPKVVMEGVSGCCGQMDIQCCDNQLLVAENTSFRVGLYDSEGKPVSQFGKQDRTSHEGFGSCCNPMNVRPMDDGTILTAESSIGHIKRFDASGKLIAYIGKAKIGGGCKHCALGYDKSRDQYFMMHQDASEICVLSNNKDLLDQTEEEAAISKMQEKYSSKISGKWRNNANLNSKPKSGVATLLSGLLTSSTNTTEYVDQMVFHPNGKLQFEGGQLVAMYGDGWQWRIVEESKDGCIKVALDMNQVEYFTMDLSLDAENKCSVSLPNLGVNHLQMTRIADCNGKPCDKDCEAPSLPVEPAGEAK